MNSTEVSYYDNLVGLVQTCCYGLSANAVTQSVNIGTPVTDS